jgi:hypothetical protein
VSPTEVIERVVLLPTMMDERSIELGGHTVVKLPAFEVVWLEALVSTTQLMTIGGVKAMVMNKLASDC